MCRAGKVRLINVMRRQQSATLPMQPPPTLLRAETAGAEGREKDIQGVPTRFSISHYRTSIEYLNLYLFFRIMFVKKIQNSRCIHTHTHTGL